MPCDSADATGAEDKHEVQTGCFVILLFYFTYTLGGLARIRATISFLLVDASSDAS